MRLSTVKILDELKIIIYFKVLLPLFAAQSSPNSSSLGRNHQKTKYQSRFITLPHVTPAPPELKLGKMHEETRYKSQFIRLFKYFKGKADEEKESGIREALQAQLARHNKNRTDQ